MNARAMREQLDVLQLTKDEAANRYDYTVARRTYAQAAVSEKTNVFSRVGIGARDVVFTMRHSPDLQPGRLLLWQHPVGCEYCYVSAVTPKDRHFDTVHAARVQLAACTAEANHTPRGAEFQAVLTEKYVGHEQLDPLAINVTTYVLVCPPEVKLKRGSIVEVNGAPYVVLLGHYLDVYKTEYEIQRTEDL